MPRTGNLELIKNINKSLVLDIIREEQPISRAGVAKRLNLSKATVSSIVDGFIRENFVIETGAGESTNEGGRRGINLMFNAKAAFGVGVDIGGTKTIIAITDFDGEVQFRKKLKTPKDLAQIGEMIKSTIDCAPVDKQKIIAVGIGFPGATNSEKGIVLEMPFLGLKNIDAVGIIGNMMPYPVFINNDVNCAALGERWLGSGNLEDDMVFITIGTGVGCAIICNGQLVSGSAFSAGEIGYFLDEEDVGQGKKNILSQFGVLEGKISGSSFETGGMSAEEILTSYRSDDENAAQIIERFIEAISVAISNIVSLLNPAKVVIGGGVSLSMPPLLDEIRRRVSEYTPISTEIELSSLKEDAGALGAISFALSKIQEII